MLNPPLDVDDDLPGIELIPAPVKVFGDGPKLDDKVPGEVLRFDLPRFSCQSRTRATSSPPMMIRASEPPINDRRSATFPCRKA